MIALLGRCNCHGLGFAALRMETNPKERHKDTVLVPLLMVLIAAVANVESLYQGAVRFA